MGKQPARDHLAFIAELSESLREAQRRQGLSSEERGRYARWLEHARSLASLLEMGRDESRATLSAQTEEDLPPALLSELKGQRPDRLEYQIIEVLVACNGSADLDQVLIGLYRGFGVIEKRRVIQNKLWRLVRKGRIKKAKDTRNIFSLLSARESRGHRGKRRQ